MSLCTLAEVKSFINLDGTTKDDRIDDLILAAQGFIEEYCNRAFEKLSVTEYYHGGVNRIGVKRPPIASSPAPVIYEDADRDYEAEDLVDADDYFVDEENGFIDFDYEIMKGFGAIKITYTGGYAVIPYTVKQACIELVVRKLKTGDTGDIGVLSRGTSGGGNVSFSLDALLPETKRALELFKKEPFAI